MEKREPKEETLIKLQKRKIKTWARLVKDTSLKPVARIALWFMLDNLTKRVTAIRYEDEGRVYINPSQKGIAAQTGVDKSTIKRAIQEAIARGYLKQTKQGSGFSGNSEYRVMPLKKP